jgi:adenylate cyclase
LGVKFPTARSVRLTAGLVMFAYATCHFISHATGLFLLNGIQAIGHDIVLAPWRTPVGLSVLLISFTLHLGLGLYALYRRRTLRMPAIEAWQLGLGLTIPLLLAPHVADARLGVMLYGLEDSYFRVLYLFWITAPAANLTRQFALLLAVWTHGCIGLHMWLRFRPWYRRRFWIYAAAATSLPVLAILGVTNAGWDTALRAAVEPGFAAAHGPPAAGSPHAGVSLELDALSGRLQLVYLALVALTFLARAFRNARARRLSAVRIDYRGGRKVTVPQGFSILEASRWAGIPHVSVCGGRGRCSTCRVRILRGLETLPPPEPPELSTLERIAAPAGVRLACQTRPRRDLAVAPLISAAAPLDGLRFRYDEGRELLVTALYADLRDSTRLAADRLPYDALFIVDRYIQAATSAILAHGGHVTSVAGDGVMSVFGLGGDARLGARNALVAAHAMWSSVGQINEDLAPDIGPPLRFGLGVHSGWSVVGFVGPAERSSLQFLGDTGNVAARLEALTKEMNCVAIVSAATLDAAQWTNPGWRRAELDIRGRDHAADVFLVEQPEQLRAIGAPFGEVAHPRFDV